MVILKIRALKEYSEASNIKKRLRTFVGMCMTFTIQEVRKKNVSNFTKKNENNFVTQQQQQQQQQQDIIIILPNTQKF